MKRQPLLASFVLFIALCASAAYWAMQLFKPPVRPVAAPPSTRAEIKLDEGGKLFGGYSGVAAASNFQLSGMVIADEMSDSVAILTTDGKPAQSIRVGAEVVPGVILKEVHKEYVLLLERGVSKRVELPDSSKMQAIGNPATSAPVAFGRNIQPLGSANVPALRMGMAPTTPPPAPPNANSDPGSNGGHGAHDPPKMARSIRR